MTEEEHNKFYFMGDYAFTRIKNPTAQQCLAFLRGYKTDKAKPIHLTNIPEKHRTFCKAQIKMDLQLLEETPTPTPIPTPIPTAEQCMVWLRNYPNYARVRQLRYIPKKHKEFCKAQLKLEGLL